MRQIAWRVQHQKHSSLGGRVPRERRYAHPQVGNHRAISEMACRARLLGDRLHHMRRRRKERNVYTYREYSFRQARERCRVVISDNLEEFWLIQRVAQLEVVELRLS